MSWLDKIWPFTWRAEKALWKKQSDQYRAWWIGERERNQKLLEEHRRVGEKAAKNFPINEMFSPYVDVAEDYAYQNHTFRIQLRPVAVQYVLPHRHLALSETGIQAFADHIADRIGREFSRLLTDDWVKQGAIKKL